MRKFTIMAEYLDGHVRLMSTDKDYLIADEENVQYLRELGDRLLEAGSINSYHILELVGSPVSKVE
jgi:hypothetical protein